MDIMENLKNFIHIYMALFIGTTFFYFLMLKVSKSNNLFLKKYFHAVSGKSVSNAILLGGLPLAISILASTTYIAYNPYFEVLDYQKNILLSMVICSGFIVIYGYFDDRFELRPIVKLVMQFMAVTSFSLLTSKHLSVEYSNLALFIQFFVGMALVNGTNLLDGLDTLTIKLSTAGFLGFVLLGALNFTSIITVLALSYIAPLFSFYIFNKEPAKIHLGEIGSSFIGFIYFALSTLFFSTLQYKTSLGYDQIFFIVTLPTLLPIIELTISFFRRLYNRKSPFSGDRFHVHQILRNFHNISPSNVSNIMGGTYFLTMFFSIVSTHYYNLHPFFSFLFLSSVILACSFSIGIKHWKGPDAIILNAKSIFDTLRKKDVTFVETKMINDFEFHIMKEGSFEEEEEEEDHVDGGKKDKDYSDAA